MKTKQRSWRAGAAGILLLALTALAASAATDDGVATRTLPAAYLPGNPVQVGIAAVPSAGTLAWAVEEQPPVGWTVSAINEGGAWDAVNSKVKWGPFFDTVQRDLSYQATPPAGASGVKTFTGVISSDGVPEAIGGAGSIGLGVPPSITSANAATFVVGSPGSFMVTATGVPLPSLGRTGTLPAGVAFTDNGNGTATLAGTPAAGTGGAYALTITASNGVGSPAQQSFTLRVHQPPAITSANAATFIAGQASTFTITTTGYPAPSVGEAGTLPTGVMFADNGNGTATISGTPAAGTGRVYPLTISASNGVGNAAYQAFTLTVNQEAAITSANQATLTVGSFGSFMVTATGYPAPTLSRTGTLPTGVTFTNNGNASATLGGTPAAGTGGAYPLTITASNGIGAPAQQAFTLTVQQAPAITSANSATFSVGAFGSFTFTATGYPVPAVSRTGSLPAGVTFTNNGNGTATIAGTPAAGTGGAYPLTIRASNGVGLDAQQGFNLTVTDIPISISGHVRTAGGGGVPGVVMGGLPGTPSTDPSGFYTSTVPSGWNGAATPSKPGWVFVPGSRSYVDVTVAQTGDYTESAAGNAVYDASLRVPACMAEGSRCDTGGLVSGRALLGTGPEPNQPNTLGGTCADGTQGAYQVDESVERIRVASVDGAVLAAGGLAQIDVTAWTFSEEDVLDIFHASEASAAEWVRVVSLPVTGPGNHVLSTTMLLSAGGLQALRAQLRFRSAAAPCSAGDLDDHDDVAFRVAGSSVSIKPSSLVWGVPGTVPVVLGAQGNEHSVAFSLTFDPATLAYQSASVGSGAAGATLQVDDTEAASGRVGFVVSMPASQTFPAGSDEVVAVAFVASGGTGRIETEVGFGDEPSARVLTASGGAQLPAAWNGGQVAVGAVAVTGVSPDRGSTTGDEMVTVRGIGFIPGQTLVRFGDEPSRSVRVQDSTSLVAVTPPGAAGVVDVSVALPAGPGSLPSSFTYEPPAATDGPDVRLAMTHAGTFAVGVNGTYTLQVTNVGDGSTEGEVVVVDTLPAGLAYVGAQGIGWTCTAEGIYVGCRHAGPLQARTSLPVLQITVGIEPAAVPSVTNRARAWTAGEHRGWDNEAADVAIVTSPPAADLPGGCQ